MVQFFHVPAACGAQVTPQAPATIRPGQWRAVRPARDPRRMTASTAVNRGTPPGDRRARWRGDPRLQAPGWVLLPLRVFLGVTFGYAGVSKLLDPAYLDAASPVGVRAQMLQVASSSPIGGLVSFAADHATAAGLLIAFGEVAVGLGALLGLLTRLAALGGVLLALSFWLTVSWTTHPYYYGADIGYAFAWTPLFVAGDGAVLSLNHLLRTRIRRELGLPARPTSKETVMVSNDVERRTVLRGGLIGAAVAAVVVAAGSVVALTRRSSSAGPAAAQAVAGAPAGSASASAPAAGSAAGGSGAVIAAAADVPVGSSKTFTAPGGGPAVLVHPAAEEFAAFHASCTHKGCPVGWTGSGFHCPCHGATFDRSGAVTGGPAKAPLTAIPVKVSDGQVTVA